MSLVLILCHIKLTLKHAEWFPLKAILFDFVAEIKIVVLNLIIQLKHSFTDIIFILLSANAMTLKSALIVNSTPTCTLFFSCHKALCKFVL
jgi:hypothetical protein